VGKLRAMQWHTILSFDSMPWPCVAVLVKVAWPAIKNIYIATNILGPVVSLSAPRAAAMHKRDLAILAVSALSIFFSLQHEGAFSFVPAWSYPLSDDVLATGDVTLPPPLVVDLNGDGRREVG
jgi:hypothetical protein